MTLISLSRLKALLRKEFLQISADRSVLVTAFIIPLCLVILYGSALRMDIKPVSVALVSSKTDDHLTREVFFALSGSGYFEVYAVNNAITADEMLRNHEITAKITLPPNLANTSGHTDNPIMITVNGADASQANVVRSYAEGALAQIIYDRGISRESNFFLRERQEKAEDVGSAAQFKSVTLNSRNRYNEGNNSVIYLMTGQLVAALTLMSAFMTSIVIAREHERGTLDGLLSTSCSSVEFLLSKIIPYYLLSAAGAALSLFTAFIVYELPFRGSFMLFLLTLMLYLYITVMIGLMLSALTKNQFLSSEYAIIVSFLPSILLSGALFDLRSIPEIISFIAHLMPPMYAVESFKISIMSGGNTDTMILNLCVLLFFALLFSLICFKNVSESFVHSVRVISDLPEEGEEKKKERLGQM